jgi:hypothetical protein
MAADSVSTTPCAPLVPWGCSTSRAGTPLINGYVNRYHNNLAPKPGGLNIGDRSNTAKVAQQFTTGSGANAGLGEALVSGQNADSWTRTTPSKQAGASINDQPSGFPGLADEPSRD